MITNFEPLIIEYPYQALDLAGDLVIQTINRVNMIIPKLITPPTSRYIQASPYNQYADKHCYLRVANGSFDVVAQYYAALQSFHTDYSFSLPEAARNSIDNYCNCDKNREQFNSSKLSSADQCRFMFIEHAELNPYLSFMRGHLSAYTVVSLAVINLQLALATELLSESAEYGKTYLNSTYYPGIVKLCKEMLANRD